MGSLCSLPGKSLLACSSKRSSVTFSGPWQCVWSIPCFPFLLLSLGLMNYLGLWLTPDTSLLQAPTPQQTSLTDHVFLLPDPLAGLHPQLWYNAPASHTTPSEGFHREEKIWLPSKEPSHSLVRRRKLTPLELTTGLATLENNRGLLWLWHPQARPPGNQRPWNVRSPPQWFI